MKNIFSTSTTQILELVSVQGTIFFKMSKVNIKAILKFSTDKKKIKDFVEFNAYTSLETGPSSSKHQH